MQDPGGSYSDLIVVTNRVDDDWDVLTAVGLKVPLDERIARGVTSLMSSNADPRSDRFGPPLIAAAKLRRPSCAYQ